MNTRTPFPFATLLALLLTGLCIGYLLSRETPRGQVTGQVVLLDRNSQLLADCNIYLTPAGEDNSEGDDARTRRRTHTDAKGNFVLRNVPVGTYSLSASAERHQSTDIKVTVEESRTVSKVLKLTRSESDLSIGDHQASFATDEKPFLPVRGYTTKDRGASLHVRVWRTHLSSILKRSDAAGALQELRYSYSGPHPTLAPALLQADPQTGKRPELVADTTLPVQQVDREGFFVNRTPITAAMGKPGLYFVQFSHEGHASCSYLLVSDLALVVKEAPQRLYGYAVHIKKGTPVGGASLSYYHKGRLAGSATTDTRGLATLTTITETKSAGEEEAEGNQRPTLVMASLGEDEAVVGQGIGWAGERDGGGDRYAVHTVTDRTFYRPGDVVQYKGIVRAHEIAGASDYTVPRGLPVTVEIRDTNGGLVARETKTTNTAGTFAGSIDTSVEGGTGMYTLVTQIAGEKHTTDIAVASYRKPEFTVTVTPKQPRYIRGETVEMTVQATYYFGTPVAGAKVRYSVFKDADWAAEYGRDSGVDDDETDPGSFRTASYRNYYGQMVTDGTVTLDEKGQAVVRVPSAVTHPVKPAEKQTSTIFTWLGITGKDDGDKDSSEDNETPAPQVETFTLTATVEDEAKRSVEAEGAARVASGDVVLNVRPEGYVAVPGKASQVIVTVRDADGKPVAGKSITLAASYDVWDATKKESIRKQLGTPQAATSGADGRAFVSVTPARTGEIQLTATAQDSANRPVQAEGNLWAAGDNADDLATDYGDLSLLTDKRQYDAGDTARVLVNASRTGQTVLLTVEGDHVYETLTVPVQKHSTVLRLPIRAEWGPNVTLAACYVRDKKFASSETPLRVRLQARELAVAVKPMGGDRYQPGQMVTYAVETRDKDSGKPVSCDLALSVVDESIFALRPDDPKALRRTFYPARSNHVNTVFSFSVEYLGDVNKAEPKIQARKKFRDTAYWQPNVLTNASGKATVSVTLPDNLTTWRASVYAVSPTTAVGYGVSKVISSKPFFVRLEKPRFLTGTDQSRLTALVHNETGAAQTVLVRLSAPSLRPQGEETRQLTVQPGAIGTAEWTVTVPADIHEAPIRVTAWTPQESGKTQYTDGIEQSLTVRPYGKTHLETFASVLENNGNATETAGSTLTPSAQEMTFVMENNAFPTETQLTLRITPSLQGALLGGLDYLVGFPYGCTEQTMSRFYPDLLVQQVGMLTDPERKAQLPRMVRDGITRLARFQHSESGAWGWWENDKDDGWMTAYVLLGLTAAQKQGYAVEPELLRKGIAAGVKLVPTVSADDRPFLLYALAEAGYTDAESNVLHAPFRYSEVRTKLVPSKLPTHSLAYLVLLGKKIGGDTTRFQTELERREVAEGRLIHWKASEKGTYYANSSDRMATALALQVILATNPQDNRIPAILRWLMQSRTDNYFGNTRDTSWVLSAFCDYLRLHPEERGTGQGTLTVRVNGEVYKTLDLAAPENRETEVVLRLPPKALHTGKNTVEIVPDATVKNAVFYAGVLRQTVGVANGAAMAAETMDGVSVKREMVRVVARGTGENFWRLTTEAVTDGKFRQGDQLRVRLTVTTTKDTNYILIEDAFPAGAEVTERGTTEMDTDTQQGEGFWYDHVDVLDDRIAFFVRNLPKGTHTLEYNLRAQTPGTYRALPTELQAMYDARVHAASGVTPMEVRP